MLRIRTTETEQQDARIHHTYQAEEKKMRASMKTLARSSATRIFGLVMLALGIAGVAAAQTVTLVSNDPVLTNPSAITTDGVNLYVGNGNRIFVVPIGGGAATELPATVATNLYPSPCCVVGLTRLGSSLFWIDPNGDPDATAIFKVSTSGGAVTKIYSGFATGQPIVDGVGIATDGTKLYTTDDVQGRVDSLNPDGSSITQLGSRFGGFFFGEHFNTLAVSGGTIFIVDPGNALVGPTQPVLVSIPATGGTFVTMFSGGPLVAPLAVAVGNGKVFIADPGAGNTIWQVPIAGGTPTALVSGAPFVQLTTNGLIFFNNALYVTDTGNIGSIDGPGAVYKVDLRTNRPPVAKLPPDQSVECASHSGTSVTLNGSGSSDPDGDTLTFAWSVDGTPVTGATSASLTQTFSLGAHTIQLTVTDPGGLTSSTTTHVTVQDTTPPTLTLSTNSVTAVLPTASATGATVNLSGIASATDVCDPAPVISNNAPATFPVGTTIVTFTATDASGNSSQKNLSVQVVYNFIGYFAPVLNSGASIFKSGRTVPVKFQLTAADGTIITNALATLQIDFRDATASGGSNTGNLFRFDPTAGQYIYNLDTTGFAPGTHLLRTTLNDGTTHDVLVSIR